jgi:DNA (cytosine-5)-methyltransferase 1
MWKHMARIIGEVRPQYAFIENSPMLTIRGLETVLCDLAALGFDARWGVVSAADVGAPHLRERIWIVANNHSNSKSTQSVNAGQICQTNHAEWNRPIPHANDRGFGWGEQQSESTQETHGKLADTNSAQCKGSGISSGIPQKNANISGYGSNAEVSDTSSIRQSGQGEYEQPFYSAESCNGKTNNAQSIGGSKLWPIEPAVGRVANGVAARMDRLKAIGNGQVPRVAETAWRLLK